MDHLIKDSQAQAVLKNLEQAEKLADHVSTNKSVVCCNLCLKVKTIAITALVSEYKLCKAL